MKRFIFVLLFAFCVLFNGLLPAKAEYVKTGYFSGQYIPSWAYSRPVDRSTYWKGSQAYQRNQNFNKMLKENFARYQASYKNYVYQQTAQLYGNGGTLNPIQPGTIRKVLTAPIQPVRNNQPATVQTYSEKYGNAQTNLKPVLINGQEYVLYNGQYLPVNND